MKTARIKNLNKSFKVGEQKVEVLKGIDLEIDQDDFMVIFGPSGCGKSTLLHSFLGLEHPDSGSIEVLGLDIYKDLDEDGRSEFRKENFGMVYQQANWIKSLSVVENVAFPMMLTGSAKKHAIWQATDILERVEMADWANYNPNELSSGQQQRVALARALMNNPTIIIADEPTGNLDYESGLSLMNLLTELNKKHKKTIVMVTHDLEYLVYAKTAIKMLDGRIEAEYRDGDKNLKKEINNIKNTLDKVLD